MRPEPMAGHSVLADLSPACFAIVMATGIVSIAARQQGWRTVGLALFGLNIAAWLACWTLTVLRLARHPRRFLDDLRDHLRGPGFFTTVAGTAVLGGQFVLFGWSHLAAAVLAALAALLWLAFTYAIFTALTIKEDKPALDRGINGGWLLAVVATQSLAVLAALLAADAAQPWKLELNFFALSMWLWGACSTPG